MQVLRLINIQDTGLAAKPQRLWSDGNGELEWRVGQWELGKSIKQFAKPVRACRPFSGTVLGKAGLGRSPGCKVGGAEL
jgi:hypothetical protein